MKYLKLFLLFLLGTVLQNCRDEDAVKWNGKKCAVVLTYDDALDEHLDYVVPSLDKLNLNGTFYVIGSSDCLIGRRVEWQAVAASGHELGNHTLMHPCKNTPKRKKQLPPEKDLNNYTLKKVIDEIEYTNTILNKMDGKYERTFAFPCGQKKVNDTLFYNYVKDDFEGARGVKRDMKSITEINLDDINAYGMKGHSGTEMKKLVDEAIENKELLVFLFHGVGGGSPLNVELAAHQELLDYLSFKEEDIWVAPMVDVAKYVKEQL